MSDEYSMNDVKPGVSSSAFQEGSERVVCMFTVFEYLVRILLHIVNVTILRKCSGNGRTCASGGASRA